MRLSPVQRPAAAVILSSSAQVDTMALGGRIYAEFVNGILYGSLLEWFVSFYRELLDLSPFGGIPRLIVKEG